MAKNPSAKQVVNNLLDNFDFRGERDNLRADALRYRAMNPGTDMPNIRMSKDEAALISWGDAAASACET